MKPRLAPAALLAVFSPFAHADQGMDFFEKKVRPLLAERCLECHSADQKIKGGLRLDTRDGWAKGGDSGPAAHPGEPDKSLLVEAVRYANRDMQMPPKQKLSKEEIGILEQWVSMGAPDPRTDSAVAKKKSGMSLEEGRRFWSYAPVSKPQPPAVRDSSWALSEIDRFLQAGMERVGVVPSPDASPNVLARRLYLNLTGLPPTPEQTESFVTAAAADKRAATTQLVDQLLSSPHFGEVWGRHWLDITRFAESSGGGRTLLFKDAWRFRDYVLESINADVPLNQFIQEQIAGDLMHSQEPAQRRRQITASAFLALGPTNYEEQEKQQLRFDIIDEQLETIGRAFLGQTIGCARCHDHKFDPISQHDYYALAGIFASTKTLLNYTDNVARWISMPLPADGPRETELLKHEAQLADLRKELESARAAVAEASKSVSAEIRAPGMPLDPAKLPGIVLDDSDARVVGQWRHSTNVRSFIGKGYLSDENSGKGAKTVTFTPSISEAGRYEVRLAYSHSTGRAKNVRVTVFHADGEDAIFVDQTEPPPLDGRFVSLGKFRFEKDGAGYVLISNEGTRGFVTVDALQLLPEGAPTANTSNTTSSGPKGTQLETAPGAEARKQVKELEARLKKLEKDGPNRETAMAVQDDPKAANTQIRVRGIERQRGQEVPRGFLQVAMHSETPNIPEAGSGRMELAQWITANSHPLTARVLANRIWAWLWGTGIVTSVDNFGTTGDVPSNPELLDHLASRLIENGWSLKKLVREIVLSRAWQQEASPSSATDPDNKLFSHANRRRLSAEQLRDTILAVSGKLDLTIGGPNIDGAGDIDANNSSAQNIEYAYIFKDVRRSFYTPAFRNKRLELFEVFDFGNINQPLGQRTTSTVAPQALFLMNSPFINEHSQFAAERLLATPGGNEAHLKAAYLQALGRLPTPNEERICRRFLDASSTAPTESWAHLFQMLFACVDFRYLD